MAKKVKWSPTVKTHMLCNMKQDMKVMKKLMIMSNNLSHKNVNVVENNNNYITAQKYILQ